MTTDLERWRLSAERELSVFDCWQPISAEEKARYKQKKPLAEALRSSLKQCDVLESRVAKLEELIKGFSDHCRIYGDNVGHIPQEMIDAMRAALEGKLVNCKTTRSVCIRCGVMP